MGEKIIVRASILSAGRKNEISNNGPLFRSPTTTTTPTTTWYSWAASSLPLPSDQYWIYSSPPVEPTTPTRRTPVCWHSWHVSNQHWYTCIGNPVCLQFDFFRSSLFDSPPPRPSNPWPTRRAANRPPTDFHFHRFLYVTRPPPVTVTVPATSVTSADHAHTAKGPPSTHVTRASTSSTRTVHVVHTSWPWSTSRTGWKTTSSTWAVSTWRRYPPRKS